MCLLFEAHALLGDRRGGKASHSEYEVSMCFSSASGHSIAFVGLLACVELL